MKKLNKMFKGNAPFLLLLAALTIGTITAGTLLFKNSDSDPTPSDKNQETETYGQAAWGTQETQEEAQTTEFVPANVTPSTSAQETEKEKESEKETKKKETKAETEAQTASETEAESVEATQTAPVAVEPEIHFPAEGKISWPVNGEIVLDFSMDATIYHPTLDLYKCSSGIAIQSEVGTQVLSPAAAKVLAVGQDEEIGQFVVLDLGDGYQAKCGQLKDIQVTAGQSVEAGQVIASVENPTKYYSVEGTNVYFSLTKDGTPVDPLDYLN